jgi:hypothetical protein
MSDQAATDVNTHTSAHIIIFFAFFVFSSSPLEIRYIIPPNITAITAITATYLISNVIIFPSISYIHDHTAALEQPGKPQHSTSGAANPS